MDFKNIYSMSFRPSKMDFLNIFRVTGDRDNYNIFEGTSTCDYFLLRTFKSVFFINNYNIISWPSVIQTLIILNVFCTCRHLNVDFLKTFFFGFGQSIIFFKNFQMSFFKELRRCIYIRRVFYISLQKRSYIITWTF